MAVNTSLPLQSQWAARSFDRGALISGNKPLAQIRVPSPQTTSCAALSSDTAVNTLHVGAQAARGVGAWNERNNNNNNKKIQTKASSLERLFAIQFA